MVHGVAHSAEKRKRKMGMVCLNIAFAWIKTMTGNVNLEIMGISHVRI